MVVLNRINRRMWAIYIIYLIGLIFSLSIGAFATTVIPSQTDIEDDYSKQHEYVITVINDGAKFENIMMEIDPYSAYLSEYVTIEPRSFTLLANEKKNIKLSTRFPKNLSPEKHELIITAKNDDNTGPSSIYSFTIEGIQRPNLKIENVLFNNVSNDQSLYITLVLDNKGNIIARSFPTIDFLKDGEVIDTIQYKYLTTIMPGTKANLTLGYDSSVLAPGRYLLRTKLKYNKELLTNELEKELMIFDSKTQTKEGLSANSLVYFVSKNLYLIIFIILVLIGSRIIFTHRKSRLEEHLEKKYKKHQHKTSKDIRLGIEIKINALEHSINMLANETETFINESNTWLKTNFGDKYEFK